MCKAGYKANFFKKKSILKIKWQNNLMSGFQVVFTKKK